MAVSGTPPLPKHITADDLLTSSHSCFPATSAPGDSDYTPDQRAALAVLTTGRSDINRPDNRQVLNHADHPGQPTACDPQAG